jgi:hypothetical protein
MIINLKKLISFVKHDLKAVLKYIPTPTSIESESRRQNFSESELESESKSVTPLITT